MGPKSKNAVSSHKRVETESFINSFGPLMPLHASLPSALSMLLQFF